MKDPGNSDWQDCPRDVIAGLVAENRRLSRRAAILRITTASAIGFAGVASGAFMWANRRPPTRDELREDMLIQVSCKDVMSLLGKYHNDQLCEALTRRIHYHLTLCHGCRRYYELHHQDAVV